MASIENLGRYLQGMTSGRPRAGEAAAGSGGLPFITVSRQAGAGGRSVARAILAELEKRGDESTFRAWSSFDEELCKMIVSDPDLRVSFRELVTEEYRTRAEDFISVMLGKSFQDDVQAKIAVTIRHLAQLGKAILIGRGAVAITRDLARGVHIRLVAPRDLRIQKMMKSFEISEGKAVQWVDEQDRSRARMMRHRYKLDIDDPLLYDAVWNTDSVAPRVIASCVVEMVERTGGEGSA